VAVTANHEGSALGDPRIAPAPRRVVALGHRPAGPIARYMYADHLGKTIDEP
jgi:hypothetical protein